MTTSNITPEMVAAWRTLQEFALRAPYSNVGQAIKVLDNSDFMVPVEAATPTCAFQVGGGYESPPEYCDLEIGDKEEYCSKHQQQINSQQPDPAEWGDTTRADMARHQQL